MNLLKVHIHNYSNTLDYLTLCTVTQLIFCLLKIYIFYVLSLRKGEG